MPIEQITPEALEAIRGNKRVRQRLAYESPLWFSLLYLNQHFTHPFAPFHIEMFRIVADEKYRFVVVMAFRGSGKSTVMNMATVLWSILGKPDKKFVVIVSRTQEQAKNHFANIKEELENNIVLREDFGPFAEKPEEWRKLSLDLVYHDAKILSLAREQSIRGLRHGPHRPDLIVCDDLEDSGDAKNGESIYGQFAREIAPSGDPGTRVIALGNLIDKDSFLMRLRKDALDRSGGIFRAYPIIDSYGKTLWPGKYPDAKSIGQFKMSVPSAAWTREYLLDAVSEVSYYEPPRESEEERKWLLAREAPLSRRMSRAMHTYRRALEKAGKLRYQDALIRPMKRFSIESPFPEDLARLGFDRYGKSETPDPPYLREYKSEMRQISDEYNKVLSEFFDEGYKRGWR
jgi:hypothetical protein